MEEEEIGREKGIGEVGDRRKDRNRREQWREGDKGKRRRGWKRRGVRREDGERREEEERR